jgi:uncharacterized protein
MSRSSDTVPNLFAGAALFNAGRFFEAHEVWEEVWLREAGRRRRLLQGLIQIAAGFHKASLNEPKGCVALLEAGLGKLQGATDAFAGFPLARFRSAAEASLEAARGWRRGQRKGPPEPPILEVSDRA